MPSIVAQVLCAATVIGLRILAFKYNWSLPALKVKPENMPKDDNLGTGDSSLKSDNNDN